MHDYSPPPQPAPDPTVPAADAAALSRAPGVEAVPATADAQTPAQVIGAPVVGDGPAHTHATTYSSYVALVVGGALIIASKALPAEADVLVTTGLAILVGAVGGASIGKSPAIR